MAEHRDRAIAFGGLMAADTVRAVTRRAAHYQLGTAPASRGGGYQKWTGRVRVALTDGGTAMTVPA